MSKLAYSRPARPPPMCVLAVIAAMLLAACTAGAPDTCTSDEDCGSPDLLCIQGRCEAVGDCRTDRDCGEGQRCDAGRCVPTNTEGCMPSCPAGASCREDGCGGFCGDCLNPPASDCSDSTTARSYQAEGECTAEGCLYPFDELHCASGCEAGVCVDCEPNCDGRQCGDDNCGGSCGECPDGSSCNDGTCECVPACSGRQCGDDRCGGSCGSCGAGYYCSADHACECDPLSSHCGEPGTLLMGLGEPIVWNTVSPRNLDLDRQLDHLIALKPTVHRMWMHLAATLSNETTVVESWAEKYDQAIGRLQAAGIEIVAMDHFFPVWMTGQPEFGMIPCRDETPGSTYQSFLDSYESAWKTLVSRFPAIRTWQPGNEFNHDPFLRPGPCGQSGRFTFEEKAAITTDLMFRSRRAIREARPDAFVYMPSIAPVRGTGQVDIDGIETFLDMLYRNIDSGLWPSTDPRDYFDGVSWHPYIWANPTQGNWVKPNLDVYKVMSAWGDGHVPVMFSEYGNADMGDESRYWEMSQRMRASYDLASAHFPWLRIFVWFRMLDDPAATWGGEGEKYYGILRSPREQYAWKPSAAVFFSITEGVEGCPLPAGFFRIGATAYYSNGAAYCVFTSWEAYVEAGGHSDLGTLLEVDLEPECMQYHGACH